MRGGAERGTPVRWLGPTLLVVTGAWLLVATWRAWPDPIVDFGRELYAPWRIAAGEVLYRDLAWFNGPLSAYWNALWFRLAGVGFGTLIAVNTAVLAVFTALAYRSLLRLSTPLAATVGCLFFLVTFAFGQTSGVGNYDFLAPYSHEAVHGLVLAVAALVVLDPTSGDPGAGRGGAAGLAVGLAFLTKPEVFAAGLAGALVALVLGRGETGRGGRVLAAFAGGLALPPVLAWAALASALPAGEALAGVLGAWPAVLAGDVARLPFYRGPLGTGLDAPGANLAAMAAWSAGLAAVLGLGALAGRVSALRTRRGAAVLGAAGLVLLGLLPIDWADAGRPLPVLLAASAAGLVVARRRAREPAARRLQGRRLAFVLFALVLLAKSGLVAKLWHYGFVLSTPACLVASMAFLCWLPEAVEHRGRSGVPVGALGLAVLTAAGWRYAEISASAYAARRFEVGSGTDRIVADARGLFAERALDEVLRRVPADGTLLVLPEGVSLAYLARRRAPTKYLNYMPLETILFGEGAMLDALRASPPDAVLLVHKDTSEYGLPLFGRDYGQDLLTWVRERYAPVWTDPEGDPPLEPGSRFGTALWLPRR